MTRPGYLVHAEQEAREEAERHGWDGRPEYEPPSTPSAVEDAHMQRIREAAALMHEQRRRERHWAVPR